MITTQLIDQLKAARRVSTPLVAVTTSDPAETIEAIRDRVAPKAPIVSWDIVRGFRPCSDGAAEVIARTVGEDDGSVGNPLEAMKLAERLPRKTVLCVHMADRWLANPMVVQAIWLLRDQYKAQGHERMLVLLGPSMSLPPELAGDVVVFDEPLPDASRLRRIVQDLHKAAGLKLDDAVLERSVEALTGLPAFGADDLRTSDNMRQYVGSGLAAIEEQLQALMVDRGVRGIELDDDEEQGPDAPAPEVPQASEAVEGGDA